MARTRLYSKDPKPMKPRAPTTPEGWRALLDRAIAQATSSGDRRLSGLLQARQDGKAEDILRLLGIVSEACVGREFPKQD